MTSGAIADFSDGAIALAVIGLLAFVLARARQKRSRKEGRVPAAMPARTPAAGRPGSSGATAIDVADRPSLAAIQARAAIQIDAAEHALNRLLAECAAVATLPIEPTFATARELPARPAARARSSLAA